MNFDFEGVLKNEPKFRLKQVKQAVFCDLIENWSEAQALPKELREKLQKEIPLNIETEVFVSDDEEVIRALVVLADELKVESVLMRHKDRNTVCVSSQVGCPLNCSFCATGKLGFKRNLSSDEIVEQILFFNRYLKKEKQRVSNVVFMGMGEPFLNYDNVLGAIKILNDKDGLNIGVRRISISTSGVVEGIEKLEQENIDVNLAISLHAPNDELRKRLMPIAQKYSIAEILRAVNEYIHLTGRKVMFEYIMIKDVNDSEAHAEELARLMNHKLYMVNLISYNATGIFKPSSPEHIKEFKKVLEDYGIEVTQRFKLGRGVRGACGQLAGE
ncbi:MAG TPA: 23S rRNA (adenine(2503)-C(2))-methyltransferase RlmN [Candidatus Paceibacterota bacterium]|nr:23S rRNA (adenine(2503)-C(2))-methyltransferase RlmN [Candidatus Paceibacterota bacterium]HPT40365.1 23S rRNA (adenine(2503)-C(2))-methyltransferase RlmN [Candidatus Paceibacterota bacterium]